mmetsp:Transcript_720/g.3023  ORF Transcript_720/g.3023 Transcript_720/m.3023 type:complete len:215 (+) Transcript_720:1551-2195(+)
MMRDLGREAVRNFDKMRIFVCIHETNLRFVTTELAARLFQPRRQIRVRCCKLLLSSVQIGVDALRRLDSPTRFGGVPIERRLHFVQRAQIRHRDAADCGEHVLARRRGVVYDAQCTKHVRFLTCINARRDRFCSVANRTNTLERCEEIVQLCSRRIFIQDDVRGGSTFLAARSDDARDGALRVWRGAQKLARNPCGLDPASPHHRDGDLSSSNS